MNRFFCTIFMIMMAIGTVWSQDLGSDQIVTESAQTQPSYEWKQILPPLEFEFPRDHGAHFDTKLEWWYVTGNLETKEGREFGIQVTFFRRGVLPNPKTETDAELKPNHLIIGHLGIADIQNNEFYYTRNTKRIGAGYAGAREDRMLVWAGDWELESHFDTIEFKGSYPEKNIDLEIQWTPIKPLVKQGDNGYAQKGKDPGNSSAYMSYTRMNTDATLTIDGETFQLSGLSWFDHEYGSSQLGQGIIGWDWWGLHLDDGRDLMLYQLRYASGFGSPFSSGTIIDQNGNTTHITHDEFTVTPQKYWTSVKSGGKYPIQWDIEIEKHDISFTVIPKLKSSEMVTDNPDQVNYWEGPVKMVGKTTGEGYMELTGYAGYMNDKM